MAMLLLESWNHLANADKATKWTQYVTTQTNASSLIDIAAVGPRSNNGLRLRNATFDTSSGSLNIVPNMPVPSGATIVLGFRFRSVSAFNIIPQGTNPDTYGPGQNGNCLFAIRKTSTTQIWGRINTNGTISIYRGTTLLGTTSSALTQNVYQYIEVKIVLNGTTGTVEVRFDGLSSPVLSLTGQNTQNAGVSTWDELRLGPVANFLATSVEWNYADLYLADGSGSDGWTDFMGDMRIDPRYATADGTYTALTPSTGVSHYALVDEASANGATDYNTAAAAGDKDSYVIQDAPVVGANILGVQVVAQASKTDAGAAGHKALTRISGADYTGTELGVPSTYAFLRQCWGKSPATSAAWTESEFNAAEFGVQKST